MFTALAPQLAARASCLTVIEALDGDADLLSGRSLALLPGAAGLAGAGALGMTRFMAGQPVPRADIVAAVAMEAALAALAGSIAGIVLALKVLAGFLRTVGFTLAQRAIEPTTSSRMRMARRP